MIMKRDIVDELELLVRSRYGLIFLETIEEDRSEQLLNRLSRRMNIPLFIWTLNKGLFRSDADNAVYGTADIGKALSHMGASTLRAIYHLQGFNPFLKDIGVVSGLKSCLKKIVRLGGSIIITGIKPEIPDSLKPHASNLTLPLPEREDYIHLLNNTYNDLKKKMPVTVEMTKRDMRELINNLQGLTLIEAKKILTKAIVEDGRLSREDIEAVINEKKGIIEKEGLLEYYPAKEGIQDIADLAGLKQWLAKRKHFIVDAEKAKKAGLTFPKGVLLLGVPGTGKSLCAKAVAREWGLPLLKMDPANLYSKYIGETEKKFKQAMQIAEKMSPLVLWVDEIEKAFASGGNEDGGVSMRVLGSFLSWMQDREGDVFVVATANDVSRLPPELLRKGRFDEIFFVDLPDAETRKEITRIHLKRRGYDADSIDLDLLSRAMDGFSGAEIEQVIISSIYTIFTNKGPISTELLLDEASKTCSLLKTRYEQIQALREWARERTVLANG